VSTAGKTAGTIINAIVAASVSAKADVSARAGQTITKKQRKNIVTPSATAGR
jgi:hypothetical protein